VSKREEELLPYLVLSAPAAVGTSWLAVEVEVVGDVNERLVIAKLMENPLVVVEMEDMADGGVSALIN